MKKFLLHSALYLSLFFIVIFLFRFNLIYDLTKLLVMTTVLLFNNTKFIVVQINFRLIEFILAYLTYLSLIPLIIYSIKKNLLINKLRSEYITLFIIIFIAFSAPLLTNFSPNFYKDIEQTELLPPLSVKKYVVIKEKEKDNDNSIEKYLTLKNRIFNKSQETNIVYGDSIRVGDSVTVYAGKEIIKFSKDKLVTANSNPIVHLKMFLLGTDEFGRDILTRILYGMRLSLFIALGSAALCLLLGVVLGYFAGFYSGLIDIVLSRIVDVFLTFPSIFLVILAVVLFGNSLISVIAVLGFSGWMSLFKIVKGEVISIKGKDYFLTAVKLDLNNWSLLVKEIIPVIAGPVIVNILLQFSNVILAESALSYLGLGASLNYPSLGAMINSGQGYITKAWWLSVFPGIVIITLILIFNLIGERLNAMLNSRLP